MRLADSRRSYNPITPVSVPAMNHPFWAATLLHPPRTAAAATPHTTPGHPRP